MSALPGPEPEVFAFGPFVLDRRRRALLRDGALVAVTPKAFDLLVVLVERAGEVVPKDELMATLWPETSVEEGNLTFQVSTLRKALGPEGAAYVTTVPGRGYHFAAPVEASVAATETVVEEAERTTITLSESRRSPWPWAAAAVVVAALIVAGFLLLRERDRPVPAPVGIRSLAVLPFKPIAAAQRDEALELGMADTLITRLSHMPGVVIRPTSSIRRFTKLDQDPLAAGRALDVDAVVDGSIHRDGRRMRVTVRLLRTSDGKPLWAGQMDEPSHDLFAVQDRVAEGVTRVIVPAISRPAQEQIARRLTNDLEAYDQYVKGRYWMFVNAERAEEFFRGAIARDPEFAAAWAGIANTWLAYARFANVPVDAVYVKVRTAATRALAVDPGSADAHTALAQVYFHELDWKRAEDEFRRALELNPNSDMAHGQYTYLLLFTGRGDEAVDHIRRAHEIDPLAPTWSCLLGYALDCAGRNGEAVRHMEETARVHPNLVPVNLHLGMVLTNGGQPRRGVEMFQRALDLGAEPSQLLAMKAWAYARAGEREAALRILRELEARSERETVAASNIALAWTALGDFDRAFHWLDRALDHRLFLVRAVTVSPGFAPLRKDPRYAEVRRRLKL
ncbi:MAG TPA: tetratricopeptide repeat protein [Thermoanaerobaculia bacterium]|nr:tetratricopeptide repeat protein [Thermoanaerobaculia bacterium]